MKPFHLQIQRVPASRQLSFQWFGQSAIHPEGSQELPLSVDAIPAAVSDTFVVDLNPLLADIASGTISDEEDFQAAAEFCSCAISLPKPISKHSAKPCITFSGERLLNSKSVQTPAQESPKRPGVIRITGSSGSGLPPIASP